MRTRIVFLLAALSIALSTMGSDCINSPWLVSVDLDPLGDCYTVNTGDGRWNDVSDPIDINDLIDDTFEQDVTAFRLYDIRVRVTDNYPDGEVDGTLSYAFDFGAAQQMLSFRGPSASFKGEGVSLLDPAGLITYDQDVLDAFVQALNNEAFRPNSVTLSSEGSGPPVPPQTHVCVDLYLQADAEGN